MNQEIEYAEMLEIPVSTMNIERKKKRAKKIRAEKPSVPSDELKETVIARVNGQLGVAEKEQTITAEAKLFAESVNSKGSLHFDTSESIDTVRVYSTGEEDGDTLYGEDYRLDEENDAGRYALTEQTTPKGVRIALGIEFGAVCALCGAIFLTNVFVPNSAINTFFRTLSSPAIQTDTRTYSDFTLSGVVNDFSNVEITLSPTGVLTFQDKCCVYSAADGKIKEITKREDGTYAVCIAYSNTFTSVTEGLNDVYYTVGDEVKANIPMGYTNGEAEVQVTLYSSGELLNCFALTEENCLAWVESEES